MQARRLAYLAPGTRQAGTDAANPPLHRQGIGVRSYNQFCTEKISLKIYIFPLDKNKKMTNNRLYMKTVTAKSRREKDARENLCADLFLADAVWCEDRGRLPQRVGPTFFNTRAASASKSPPPTCLQTSLPQLVCFGAAHLLFEDKHNGF